MTTTVPGDGVGAVPILHLQESLTVALQSLRSDDRAIYELLGRRDLLQYRSTDRWRLALHDALIEMLDPSTDQCIDLRIGYPESGGAAHLPCVSLVVDGGGENDAEAVAGNVLRVSSEFHGPNQELWETTEIGAGQRSVVQIGAWSPAPERSMLLIAAIKWALYFIQDRLKANGIHSLTFTEGGVAPGELDPRVAYVPIVSATILWTFRESSRQLVPNRVRILPPTYST